MRKKLALFLCMIAAVLSLSAVPASASEYNPDNDASYIQIAERWMDAYVTFPVDQVEAYQQAGYMTEDQAAAIQSWSDLSESVGSQVQPGESTVSQQGDDVVVTVPITGDAGSAYFIATFDGTIPIEQLLQTGELKAGKFTLTLDSDSGRLGERLKSAALNTLMGVVFVFLILIIIILVISLLKYIPTIVDKLSGKGKETDVPSAETALETMDKPAGKSVDDAALAAVITAAIAAAMSEEQGTAITTDQLIVRSIKRAGKR